MFNHFINKEHKVYASYHSYCNNNLFHSGITLPNGRSVTFFVNRETGVVVVDIVAKNGKSGNEVLRINANHVQV